MAENFWETYGDEVLGEAEKAATEGLVKRSFGKLSATNRYFYFYTVGTPETGTEWMTEDITVEEYIERMKNKDTRRSTALEITFEVDVQEINPGLEWNYSRKVRVGDVDWVGIVVPSIEAIYGKGSMGKNKRGKTMSQLLGSYVEVHSPPQLPKPKDKHLNKETGQPYRTIEIAQVFEDKEACQKASAYVFGEPDSSLPAFPKDYGDAETWEALKESAVTPKVKELLDGEMNEAAVVKMVAKEFGVADGFIQAIVDEVIPV